MTENTLGHLCLIILIFSLSSLEVQSAERKVVCPGTSNQLTKVGGGYSSFLKNFNNSCTVIDGNLELSYIPADKNLSYLNTIREITGYLWIYDVEVSSIRLENLQIIRGKQFASIDNTDTYSVIVLQNHKLTQLVLPNLKEISNGDMIIYGNEKLCYQDMVDWTDLFGQNLTKRSRIEKNNPDCPRLRCNESCSDNQGEQHCWSSGPDDCQTLTKKNCDISCGNKRCFGNGPDQCCHDQCAAGCYGPSNEQCNLCVGSIDRGKCVENCGPEMIFNHDIQQLEPNPDLRYNFGFECVDKCPSDLLTEGNSCVKHCGEGKYNESGKCTPCPAGNCPNRCPTEKYRQAMFSGSFDYANLTNCTIVEGQLIITDRAFVNRSLDAEFLSYFSKIEEITLEFAITDTPLRNLSFLSQLKKIGSRMKDKKPNFIVMSNPNLEFLGLTSLKEFKHSKAKEHPIALDNNPKLCYINFEMLRNFTVDSEKMVNKTKIMVNLDAKMRECERQGHSCDSECVLMSNGERACWGPGPDMCYMCSNYLYNGKTCISDCDLSNSFVVNGTKKCQSCHPECAGSCNGSSSADCSECRHFRSLNGSECVPKCGDNEYADESGQCRACDSNCTRDDPERGGCTGPGNFVGKNGCRSCPGVTVFLNGTNVCSVPAANGQCNDPRFFSDRIASSVKNNIFAGSNICHECNWECLTCNGAGVNKCLKCRHFKDGRDCVSKCPKDSYIEESSEGKECRSCHRTCKTSLVGQDTPVCNGTTSFDCTECNRKFVIHDDKRRECTEHCPESHKFLYNYTQCVSTCPSLTYNFSVASNNLHECKPCHIECAFGCYGDSNTQCLPPKTGERMCKNFEQSGRCIPTCDGSHVIQSDGKCVANSTRQARNYALLIGAGVSVGLILLCFLVCFVWSKVRPKKNHGNPDYHFPMGPAHYPEESYPDVPSLTSTPDQVDHPFLRVIKREELVLANTIGTGAFGTVVRGVWLPPDNRNYQCPVAVKTLNDTSGIQQQNFIEEAKNMALIRHPCLVNLVAICMADQPLLITPLMQHGSLIDYMARTSRIQGCTMLLWAKQIAEGMEYLEEANIIHRDLAARNVLVASKQQVKISDFGLSKILKKGQAPTSEGGKFATKWLAIESLTKFEFSHKTDVWSLGITVWEILTHGEKPYADVTSHEILRFLKDGGRLPQPRGCSLELYVLLMKCWMMEPDARPTFTELKNEFESMMNEGRYLNDFVDSHNSPPPSAALLRSSSFEDDETVVEPSRAIVPIEDYLQVENWNHGIAEYHNSKYNFYPPHANNINDENAIANLVYPGHFHFPPPPHPPIQYKRLASDPFPNEPSRYLRENSNCSTSPMIFPHHPNDMLLQPVPRSNHAHNGTPSRRLYSSNNAHKHAPKQQHNADHDYMNGRLETSHIPNGSPGYSTLQRQKKERPGGAWYSRMLPQSLKSAPSKTPSSNGYSKPEFHQRDGSHERAFSDSMAPVSKSSLLHQHKIDMNNAGSPVIETKMYSKNSVPKKLSTFQPKGAHINKIDGVSMNRSHPVGLNYNGNNSPMMYPQTQFMELDTPCEVTT